MSDAKTTKAEQKARRKEIALEEAELGLLQKRNEVETSRINLLTKVLAHGPSTDMEGGTFRLESGVYDEVLTLASVIERWGKAHPGKPIRLYIFSPGGSVFHGLALYDTLRTLSEDGHEITTVIRGYAGSMASVIFLAGDERLIGAESLIHQHEPSAGVSGRASEMADGSAFVTRLYDKMARIYEARTNLTVRRFKTLTTKKEWWTDASEALELGIATRIG